jgi:hypothetical protein
VEDGGSGEITKKRKTYKKEKNVTTFRHIFLFFILISSENSYLGGE